jgi:hypothetical protein
MTTTATRRIPLAAGRKTALVAGILYLLTFASSIPALVLLGPVLDEPEYIIGSGADNQVLVGCLLDVVNALACIGTAVALFPVVKRQNEALALGFVASRVYEGLVIMVGVVSIMAVVTLRQDLAGASSTDTASLVAAGRSLVAVRDWTFLLGPGLAPAINALLLGTLMYQSRLVPRAIPLMGLIGAPLLLASFLATMFGRTDQVSAWSLLATLPVAAWEFSLGVWLVAKGFKPSPITMTTVPAGAGRPPLPVA